MKHIFLDIQKKLSEVKELKHIDKNWNQLLHEQPPVKFPCALLDIANVEYTQLGNLAQDGIGMVEITIANFQLSPGSGKAPNKHDSYSVLDIIEKIHQVLQGYTNGKILPLVRVSLNKLDASFRYEVYKVSYQTAWRVYKNTDEVPVKVTPKVTRKKQ